MSRRARATTRDVPGAISEPASFADVVVRALASLGRDAEMRQKFTDACLEFEDRFGRLSTVRDDVTGPIVDALHADAGVIRKELKNGLVFDFEYRSKIARDFVLAAGKPDHVWEPQTTKLLVHFAHGARNVIIGGAYFGDHAVPVAHAMRSAGGVCHAFEPNIDQAAMLAHNAEVNGLANLRVNLEALWSDETTRLRFVGADALAGATPSADDGGFPATTIDAYLDREAIDAIELIMLDLEGGELAALRGAFRRLSMARDLAPVVVFEIHRNHVDWSNGIAATEVGSMLTGHGYTLFAIRDFQSNIYLGDRPVELVTADTAYLDGPPHGFNMLAIKDPSLVDGALFRVCSGVSPKLLRHGDPRLHHPTGGL